MRTYAVIDNGIVTNVVLAETWNGIDVTDVSPRPGPGWLYNGATFTPPLPTIVTLSEVQRADLLARMTPVEVHGWVRAAERARNTNTPTLADRNALYAWVRWESMRGDVDLTSDDIRGLAQVWIALGMTQARAEEILAPLVQ